jgi:hypothetical protein
VHRARQIGELHDRVVRGGRLVVFALLMPHNATGGGLAPKLRRQPTKEQIAGQHEKGDTDDREVRLHLRPPV